MELKSTYAIYPRSDDNKKIDGLTPDELREAMEMYTEKMRSEIIDNLEKTFGIRLDLVDDDGEMLSYFHFVIDQAMNKGMELVIDRWRLTSHYEEQKNMVIDRITNYEFELNKGVSGVLLPDGQFIKCGNAEHHLITEKVAKGLEYDCLYFSSLLNGVSDGNISHAPIRFSGTTKEQNQWMRNHSGFFDNGQLNIYQEKFKRTET
jgi:hypothetical protein